MQNIISGLLFLFIFVIPSSAQIELNGTLVTDIEKTVPHIRISIADDSFF